MALIEADAEVAKLRKQFSVASRLKQFAETL